MDDVGSAGFNEPNKRVGIGEEALGKRCCTRAARIFVHQQIPEAWRGEREVSSAQQKNGTEARRRD
jgi:hypothetical protein